MYHNELLHAAHVAGINFHTVVYKVKDEIEQAADTCLLQIMKIHSKDKVLKALWDSGASISLITFRMAKILGLKGNKVNLSISKVGGVVENMSSFRYNELLRKTLKTVLCFFLIS